MGSFRGEAAADCLAKDLGAGVLHDDVVVARFDQRFTFFRGDGVGEDDDPRLGQDALFAHLGEEREAIGGIAEAIDEDQSGSLFELSPERLVVGGDGGGEAEGVEFGGDGVFGGALALEEKKFGRVLTFVQRSPSGFGEGFGGFFRRGLGGGRKGNENGKSRSFAGRAGEIDRSAHHGDDALGKGEAEADAAVGAGCRAVPLDKRLKKMCLDRWVDSDSGVADSKGDGAGPVLGAGLNGKGDAPLRGEFDRVVEEVEEDLLQTGSVAHSLGRKIGGHFKVELDAFGPCREANHFDGLVSEKGKSEWPQGEVHPTGFDLREVEDVIEQGHERVSTGAGGTEEVFLLRVEGRAVEEVKGAEDAVEWGADFVAHILQEVAFGAAGSVGGVAGLAEDLEGVPAFGDVAGDPKDFDRAIGVADKAGGRFDPEAGAILAREGVLKDGDVVAIQHPADIETGAPRIARAENEVRAASDHSFCRVARELCGCGVDGDEAGFEIDGEDGVTDVVENLASAGLEVRFAFDTLPDLLSLAADASAEGEDPKEHHDGGEGEEDEKVPEASCIPERRLAKDPDVVGGAQKEKKIIPETDFSVFAEIESREADLRPRFKLIAEEGGKWCWEGDVGEALSMGDEDLGALGEEDGPSNLGGDFNKAFVHLGGDVGSSRLQTSGLNRRTDRGDGFGGGFVEEPVVPLRHEEARDLDRLTDLEGDGRRSGEDLRAGIGEADPDDLWPILQKEETASGVGGYDPADANARLGGGLIRLLARAGE